MSVATDVRPISIELQSHVTAAIAATRERGSAMLLTYAEPLPPTLDPVDFLAASSACLGDGVLWSAPDSVTTFAGAGVAHEIRADGPGRFRSAISALRDLRQRIIGTSAASRFPVLGGFAFSDHLDDSPPWRGFPAARLLVPSVLLQVEGSAALLRVTRQVNGSETEAELAAELADLLERGREWARADSVQIASSRELVGHSVPDQQAWQSSVATAVSIIQQGTIDKVVLAREERVLAGAPIPATAALRRLGESDPAATLFAMQSGGAWFIGASPERLVRLDRGRVDVSCLAGSITIGESPEDQQRLAEQLLASAKDREEHEIVVRSTMVALKEVCEDVSRLPNTPHVVTARSVQHLESPVSAVLPRSGHVLDLVARLHPTPAVGGFPRERALAVMRELEDIERGWYAGPIGWTDLEGSGDFAVAIRSALISENSASLYAGCGIVAGSDPADEFAETRLKLKPMLDALGAR